MGLVDLSALRVLVILVFLVLVSELKLVLSAEVKISEKIRIKRLLGTFLILNSSNLLSSKQYFLHLFGRYLPILDLYSWILIAIIKS